MKPLSGSSPTRQDIPAYTRRNEAPIGLLWPPGVSARIHGAKHRPWLTSLLARLPTEVAAIALARMVYALQEQSDECVQMPG